MWSKCLEKLEEFKELKDNWDSYGGKTPSLILIEKCRKIIDILSYNDSKSLLSPFLAPCSGGEELSIEIRYKGKELELGILEDKIDILKIENIQTDIEKKSTCEEIEVSFDNFIENFYCLNLIKWLVSEEK